MLPHDGRRRRGKDSGRRPGGEIEQFHQLPNLTGVTEIMLALNNHRPQLLVRFASTEMKFGLHNLRHGHASCDAERSIGQP